MPLKKLLEDFDALIIGQGIAGTLLDFNLSRKGLRCLVIDDRKDSCSLVAAGVLNPVTGRRFALSWNADTLFPIAFDTYKALGEELGEEILAAAPFIHCLNDQRSVNDWLVRTADEVIKPFTYQGDEPFAELMPKAFQAYEDIAVIHPAGRARFEILIPLYREKLIRENRLVDTRISYEEIKALSGDKPIIFCQGNGLKDNPWFGDLPLWQLKGDVLMAEIKDYHLPHAIVKNDLSYVPYGGDLFWVGSNYNFDIENSDPSPAIRAEFEASMKTHLKLDYKIVEHRAAIRPATRDRRPYIGQHPTDKHIYLLNGLGTKGASFGPACAQELTELIVSGTPVRKEFDLMRYYGKGLPG